MSNFILICDVQTDWRQFLIKIERKLNIKVTIHFISKENHLEIIVVLSMSRHLTSYCSGCLDWALFLLFLFQKLNHRPCHRLFHCDLENSLIFLLHFSDNRELEFIFIFNIQFLLIASSSQLHWINKTEYCFVQSKSINLITLHYTNCLWLASRQKWRFVWSFFTFFPKANIQSK